jgi:hypothetical protein
MTPAMRSSAREQELSKRLCDLAAQSLEIAKALDQSGYGGPALATRETIRRLAGSAEAYQHVERYWVEYAKERLAARRGPMDILRGDLPPTTSYRSAFLDTLRANAKAGLLKSDGPIVSPQIEPTLKRYIEMFPSDPYVVQGANDVKTARFNAIKALHLQEMPGFELLDAGQRYEILMERYQRAFERCGFTLTSRNRQAVVFSKTSSDGLWNLGFADESFDDMTGGQIDALLLVAPATEKKALSRRRASATFLLDDLVPGFASVCGFNARSFASLLLAADANVVLTNLVFEYFERAQYGGA